ncbi:MAG: hypothetical protein JO116_07360 [Planctomycetaceae bacterium]|nr:hypothetical protein [Planctomycetaceae bacterium]
MSEFNPYAPPRADVSFGRTPAGDDAGVWKSGKLLVMTKDAALPDRCVRCNQPADGLRLRRNLSWHPAAWFLLLAISPLLYIIVALIVRKTAKIEVGLCEEHRARRRRAITMGWLVSLAGIALMLGLGVAVPDQYTGMGILIGVVILFIGILYGVIGAQVTPPKRIDKRFVWLSRVSPDYLAQLPAWGE